MIHFSLEEILTDNKNQAYTTIHGAWHHASHLMMTQQMVTGCYVRADSPWENRVHFRANSGGTDTLPEARNISTSVFSIKFSVPDLEI